ncbi:hypothetical protein KQI65_05305 [bacterium]|nr:hypothetical protein [bacterium]
MGSYGSYFVRALRNPVGLLTLAGFGAISLVSMNPIPLFIGLGLEAGFVTVAPMLPAWRRRVDAKDEQRLVEEGENRAKEMLRKLPDSQQQRYRTLRQTAVSIRENYARYNDASRNYLEQLSGRLDDMLLRYLRMLITESNYTKHLAEHSATELEGRIRSLQDEMAQDDERVRTIKEKQLSILQQRREKLTKADGDREVLAAQLSTLEELMQLLKEQAITMKEPDEMNAQLDSLMSEIEHTEDTVTALESSFETLFDRELRAAEEQKRLQSE